MSMPTGKVVWNGPLATKKAHDGAAKGILGACKSLMQKSQKIAPHFSGELVRGADYDLDEAKLIGVVSYGNNDSAPYVERQHEDLELRHPNGRQAKFLESTLNENAEKMNNFIADAIKRALGG